MYPDNNLSSNSGVGLQNSVGLAGATTKESPTEREIMQLGKATSELSALANDLENRLTPVLRQQPESKSINEGVPIEPLTALPSAIREQKDSVGYAISVLRSILNRLEL